MARTKVGWTLQTKAHWSETERVWYCQAQNVLTLTNIQFQLQNECKFRYLYASVTFPFGFCQNSKEIYRSQIEPVWHDIISSPPGEYILFSHNFRKRKNPVSNWTLKYSLKHCSQVQSEASQ